MEAEQLLPFETTCDSVLNELQLIWDDIGETDEERDQILLQIEQECLQIYQQKLDQAKCTQALLQHTVEEIESEITALASSLGEDSILTQLEEKGNSLKETLAASTTSLEEMHRKKEERLEMFSETAWQLYLLQQDFYGSLEPTELHVIDEHNLSLSRLAELQDQLSLLQKEKSHRLDKVFEGVGTIQELCAVLDIASSEKIIAVHPSLEPSLNTQSKSIDNLTLQRLTCMIEELREEKRNRMQKMQDLGTSLLELWSLMDTTAEEQETFQHVTSNIAAKEHEVTAVGILSMNIIEKTELEVCRLTQLKASKMKELVLKKNTELQEICVKGHLKIDAYDEHITSISLDTGMVDLAQILADLERQIGEAKEEVFSRKDILDKVEKWMAACEEEAWLEEYNKDENRYSVARGAHVNLKRAERARTIICKLSALIETLVAKTRAWEEDRGKPFLYSGVRLLSTLEENSKLRSEKEKHKRRLRDQRKSQEQQVNQQERLSGTKSSSNSRTPSTKGLISRAYDMSAPPMSRRLSMTSSKLQPRATETMAIRTNGVNALRLQTPGRKETIKHGLRHAVALTNHGVKVTNSGERKPLSPVSAPVQTIAYSSSDSKYQTCSPKVIAAARSSFANPSIGRSATDDEASKICDPSSSLQQHPLLEYSFEEKRLSNLYPDVRCHSLTGRT